MTATTKPSTKVSTKTKRVGRPQGRSSEETRTLIMDSARSCFVEKGYGATTFKDVATRAGLTPAALYTYFGSKPELYAATLEHTYTPLVPVFQSAFEQPGQFTEKLRSILMAAVVVYESNEEQTALLAGSFLEMRRHPDIMLQFKQQPSLVEEALAGVFERAVERGELPADTSIEALMTTFIGAGIGIAIFNHGSDLDVMREAMELFLGIVERQLLMPAAAV